MIIPIVVLFLTETQRHGDMMKLILSLSFIPLIVTVSGCMSMAVHKGFPTGLIVIHPRLRLELDIWCCA